MIEFVARNWPFANGSGRIIEKYAKGIDLGKGERLTQTSDGFSMSVLAHDLIGRHILMTGKFDRSIVQVLLDQARPGDVLLDIGANVGYVTGCFLTKINEGQAICVDPQPGIAELLRKNMAQFDDRVKVHQVALSDKAGELRFHIDQDNRGASRITLDGEIAVPAIDAAELLKPLGKLDLIKMDVEGHELPVFRAMAAELKRLCPRAILFEHQSDGAAPDGPIGSLLNRAGYDVFGIDKKLFVTRLTRIRFRRDCTYNDYVAIIR